MLKVVKRIAEAVIESAFKGDFESKINDARANVEAARADLERVRAERAEAVRVAKLAFDEDPTEANADAVVHAEGKERMFTGRAQSALRGAEATLASLESEQDEAELASLDKLIDSAEINKKVDELMKRHAPTLVDAAMNISIELQLLENTARRHTKRASELRSKLNRHDPPHPSGLDFGPQSISIQHAKAKVLLEMITGIQGGREHALWLREI